MKKLASIAAIVLAVIVATALIDLSFSMLDVRMHAPGFGWLSVGPGGDSGGSGRDGHGDGQNGTYSPATHTSGDGQTEVRPGGPKDAGNASSVVHATATQVPVVQAPAGQQLATTTRILGYDAYEAKSKNYTVTGSVIDSRGNKVSGPGIELYLAKDGTGTNRTLYGKGMASDGAFSVQAAVPAGIDVGDYSLIARTVDNYQYSGSEDGKSVRVTAETALSIGVPKNLVAGTQFPANATLREKASGNPVPGQTVSIGAGLLSTAAVTDDRGVARANASFSSGGNRTITATYGGNDYYYGSTAELELPVAGAQAPDWFQLILETIMASLALQASLSIAAAIVLVIYDRTRKPAKDGSIPGSVTLQSDKPQRVPLYRIEYPGIAARLPAVWGAGEPLGVRVLGPQTGNGKLGLYLDGGLTEALTLTDGMASVVLTPGKGSHILTIRAMGGGSEALAESEVRIVDYREEVVRIFNDLFHTLRSRFEEIGPDATPRELQWAATSHLPYDKQASIDRIVSAFEIANYSLHAVGREDYVTSYVSMREIEHEP